jgi:hypothetical protein
MPKELRDIYHDMKTHGIAKHEQYTFVSSNAGNKLSKLQQITNGHCINDEEEYIIINDFKMKYIADNMHSNSVVFRKYISEDSIGAQYGIKNIKSIESLEGIDLSHMEEIWISSLTFSGAKYHQAISRMAKFNRDKPMIVNIVITKDTIENDIFNTVSNKLDFNSKMYKD